MFFQILPLLIVCVAILFVPGIILVRSTGISWCNVIATAPLVSIFLYIGICLVSGILTFSFGDRGGLILFVVALILALLFALFLYKIVLPKLHPTSINKKKTDAWDKISSIPSIGVIAAFILIGCVFGSIFFLNNLEGLSSYIQMWDNKTHLGTANAFLHSGQYDPLHSYLYSDVAQDSSAPYFKSSGFYPATWHIVVAMVASIANIDVMPAINAVNFTFSFIVFPAGIAILLMRLFPHANGYILCGALATVSFVAYPWSLLVFGPIYPQLAAFALIPSMLAIAIEFIKRFEKRQFRWNIAWCCFIFLCLLAISAVHPSAFFALFALISPFLIWQFSRIPIRLKHNKQATTVLRILFTVIGFAVILIAWIAFFNIDFIRTIATYNNVDKISKRASLINIFTLSLTDYPSQIAVCVLVIVGLFVLIRRREHVWLFFMYLLAGLLYFSCSTSNGLFAQFLTGFWYKDLYRVAAILAIAGIPVMTAGLMYIAKNLKNVAEQNYNRAGLIGVLLFITLTGLAVFWPNFTINGIGTFETAFSTYSDNVKSNYETSHHWKYTESESHFMDKVKELIGDEEVIINMPFDGSTYAYSEQDIPMYYRFTYTNYGEENGENPESVLIRTKLNEIDSDDSVKAAVDSIGAKYVLTLDSPSTGQSVRQKNIYNPDQWEGIESITTETPGFELILEDGIMRLYKIEGTE